MPGIEWAVDEITAGVEAQPGQASAGGRHLWFIEQQARQVPAHEPRAHEQPGHLTQARAAAGAGHRSRSPSGPRGPAGTVRAGECHYTARTVPAGPRGPEGDRLRWPAPAARGLGEVTRLFVVPGARGQGLGALLLDELEDAARARGLSRLRLDTRGDRRGPPAMPGMGTWRSPLQRGTLRGALVREGTRLTRGRLPASARRRSPGLRRDWRGLRSGHPLARRG